MGKKTTDLNYDLDSLHEEFTDEYDRFYVEGVKPASASARKCLLKMKKVCHELRLAIQEDRNKQGTEAKLKKRKRR